MVPRVTFFLRECHWAFVLGVGMGIVRLRELSSHLSGNTTSDVAQSILLYTFHDVRMLINVNCRNRGLTVKCPQRWCYRSEKASFKLDYTYAGNEYCHTVNVSALSKSIHAREKHQTRHFTQQALATPGNNKIWCRGIVIMLVVYRMSWLDYCSLLCTNLMAFFRQDCFYWDFTSSSSTCNNHTMTNRKCEMLTIQHNSFFVFNSDIISWLKEKKHCFLS